MVGDRPRHHRIMNDLDWNVADRHEGAKKGVRGGLLVADWGSRLRVRSFARLR